MSAMVAASLAPLLGPLHTHTLTSLLHHTHPGTFLHPRRSSATMVAVATGSRHQRVPVMRTLQFWSWSRWPYALSSIDLHLLHGHIASSVASAATIHARGLRFESQEPQFLLCFSFTVARTHTQRSLGPIPPGPLPVAAIWPTFFSSQSFSLFSVHA